MSRRGSGLAARFRNAVENSDAQRTDEEREAAAALEAARLERDALLDDLEALGADLPIDGSARIEGAVEFKLGDRLLRFVPQDDGRVQVDYTGRDDTDVQVLFRQLELGGRWVWSRTRRGRENRLPLFDQALELLLVHGLGLPDPARHGDVVPAAAEDSQVETEADGPKKTRRTL